MPLHREPARRGTGTPALCRLRGEAQAPAHTPWGRLRGDVLIESLVFMVVIAITIAAFALASVSSLRVQRSQHSFDIATEAASGQLEKARSLAWSNLAFLTTDTGYVSNYNGHPTVSAASITGERLKPTTTLTVKATQVTMQTYITWSGTTIPAYGGTKLVTVIVTWKQDGRTHTSTLSEQRSAQVNEALPTAVPSGFGTVPTTVPTPYSPPLPTATAAAGGF